MAGEQTWLAARRLREILRRDAAKAGGFCSGLAAPGQSAGKPPSKRAFAPLGRGAAGGRAASVAALKMPRRTAGGPTFAAAQRTARGMKTAKLRESKWLARLSSIFYALPFRATTRAGAPPQGGNQRGAWARWQAAPERFKTARMAAKYKRARLNK